VADSKVSMILFLFFSIPFVLLTFKVLLSSVDSSSYDILLYSSSTIYRGGFSMIDSLGVGVIFA